MTHSINSKMPKSGDVLDIDPDDLANGILPIIWKMYGRSQFGMHEFMQTAIQFETSKGDGTGYPLEERNEILLAIAEAFAFLQNRGIIVPNPYSSTGSPLTFSRKACCMLSMKSDD